MLSNFQNRVQRALQGKPGNILYEYFILMLDSFLEPLSSAGSKLGFQSSAGGIKTLSRL